MNASHARSVTRRSQNAFEVDRAVISIFHHIREAAEAGHSSADVRVDSSLGGAIMVQLASMSYTVRLRLDHISISWHYDRPKGDAL